MWSPPTLPYSTALGWLNYILNENPYPETISETVWKKALKAKIQYLFLETQPQHGRLTIIREDVKGKDNPSSIEGLELLHSIPSIPIPPIKGMDGLRRNTRIHTDSQLNDEQLNGVRINTDNVSYKVWNNIKNHDETKTAFLNAIIDSSTGNTYTLSAYYPADDRYVCCQGSMHGICNHAVAVLILLKKIGLNTDTVEDMFIGMSK